MKWRPISELSDEQRDGRVWMIKYKDSFIDGLCTFYRGTWISAAHGQKKTLKDAFIIDMEEVEFFLSEPIPELPKPQKMEWRRFEDERPPTGVKLLCIGEKGTVATWKVNEFAIESLQSHGYTHWMPIVPPEGE